MKGRAVGYSTYEEVWLEVRADLPRAELHRQFVEQFDRPDVTLEQIKALCFRKGWKTGRTGCFDKGLVPHNKGKPMPDAVKAKTAATQFKKGDRKGRANALWKPIGTERLCKDGYLERKVHDGRPLQSRWRAVHLIRWEELHGPLPAGHALKCLDGDKANTDPSNWECIPRALLPRLNGGRHKTRLSYADAEPEVKPTVLAIAKLEHKARTLRKEGAE